jgi:prepilin-type N-terminal cleavage/methylation domain-containing protein
MRHARADDGFTLVEMLVALALLGLMTAYAVGALRSLGQIARVGEDIEAAAEVEAVARHLRQTIADARAVFAPGDDDDQRLVFTGRGDRLSFVTVLNDRLERGGLYLLDYGVEADTGELTLRRRVYRPDVEAIGDAAKLRLLGNVERIEFTYCETRCVAASDWRNNWNIADRFPGLVRVAVRFRQGDRRQWRETVVPLAAAF